ncbi:hypothetical protein DAI22_08g231842 [Oryza sativa Japonica Group]|nr:hypothetical protein DAI22_08g231842 [Oryza sativa Japonica Group]
MWRCGWGARWHDGRRIAGMGGLEIGGGDYGVGLGRGRGTCGVGRDHFVPTRVIPPHGRRLGRLGFVGRRRAGDRLSPPTPGSPPPPVAPVASRPAWTPRNPLSVSPRRLPLTPLAEGVNMSDSALKDLNLAQSAELEKTKDSSKSCITKPVLNGNKCNNTEENAPPVLPDAVTNGCEAGNADVEYIDSESLTDLEDAGATLSVCHQMFYS